jgi:oligopeptide/dipeptide ABC transporter ATP-binding protein
LRETRGLSILFITHDLGVVAQLCTRVLVMYAGRIVEEAGVDEFFERPGHPYSQGLLNSLPSLAAEQEQLTCIPGSPPRPGNFPPGCRFNPRCPLATDRCRAEYPDWFGNEGRRVACWEHERARREYVPVLPEAE